MPEVPQTTSRYPVEPKPDRYVIPFAPELVEFILAGEKAITYRFGDKYDYLQEGDEINVQNNQTKEIAAPAVVTGKERTTFGQLPLDTPGHETYPSKERQREVFSGYYAYLERLIQDDDPFLVLEFKLKKD